MHWGFDYYWCYAAVWTTFAQGETRAVLLEMHVVGYMPLVVSSDRHDGTHTPPPRKPLAMRVRQAVTGNDADLGTARSLGGGAGPTHLGPLGFSPAASPSPADHRRRGTPAKGAASDPARACLAAGSFAGPCGLPKQPAHGAPGARARRF